MEYEEFLKGRAQVGAMSGFEPIFMPDKAFDFQRSLIDWSVRKGRGAVFADCQRLEGMASRLGHADEPVTAKRGQPRPWI